MARMILFLALTLMNSACGAQQFATTASTLVDPISPANQEIVEDLATENSVSFRPRSISEREGNGPRLGSFNGEDPFDGIIISVHEIEAINATIQQIGDLSKRPSTSLTKNPS